MRDVQHYDLNQATPTASTQINFTQQNDQRWAGIIELSAHANLQLDRDARNDIYLLSGQLTDDESTYGHDIFLSTGASDLPRWRAGFNGAVLFAYRDRLSTISGHQILPPADLDWVQGGVNGMRVAVLSETHHQLMLVSWQPGTRMRFHRHPQGEEIFVLRGRLIDEHGSYSAGSWQRLHVDAGHAPYVEEETLILLRNGHL